MFTPEQLVVENFRLKQENQKLFEENTFLKIELERVKGELLRTRLQKRKLEWEVLDEEWNDHNE